MAIEVEKKAIVTKDKLDNVRVQLLAMDATDLGENNTESYFYLQDDFQLKVHASFF